MENLMNLPVILALAGCAALLMGVFGGGVKAKEIVVPKLTTLPRIFSSITGLVLIGVSIWISSMPSAEGSQVQTPTTVIPTTQNSPTETSTVQSSPTELAAPTASFTEQPPTPSTMVTTIPIQTNPQSQAVFIHSVLHTNMSGNWSVIEHALTSDPNALLFAMSNFNSPVSPGGVYNRHLVAVWYRDSQWYIINQDMGFMPQGAAFNVQIISQGDNNAFIHTAITENITNSWTVINHPLAFDPNSLVFAMPTWSPNGEKAKDNIHPIGVWYTGSQWAIFNLDGAPMRQGAAFNVEILSPNMNTFVHTTTTSNTTENWTVIDDPLAFDETKLVFVTSRGSPEEREVNNSNPIGVWYQGSQWAIFNQDESKSMPIGIEFNILILDKK